MNWLNINFGRYTMTWAEALELFGIIPVVLVISALDIDRVVDPDADWVNHLFASRS